MTAIEKICIAVASLVLIVILVWRFGQNNRKYQELLWCEWGLVFLLSIADHLTTYYALRSGKPLYESMPLARWFLEAGGFTFLWAHTLGRVAVVIGLLCLIRWGLAKVGQRALGVAFEQGILVVYVLLTSYVVARNLLFALLY